MANQQIEAGLRGEEISAPHRQQWLLVSYGESGSRLACASRLDAGDYCGKVFVTSKHRWSKRPEPIGADRVIRVLSNAEAAAIHCGVSP